MSSCGTEVVAPTLLKKIIEHGGYVVKKPGNVDGSKSKSTVLSVLEEDFKMGTIKCPPTFADLQVVSSIAV